MNKLDWRKTVGSNNNNQFFSREKLIAKTGNRRNRPCPCYSGKKYKNCCLYTQQGYVKVNPTPGISFWVKGTKIGSAVFNMPQSIGGVKI